MNRSIIFTRPNVAELLDTEKKEPRAGEVCVRMLYTAISAGTERANLCGDPFVNGSKREPNVSFPRTVGYSGSGLVESVGEGVASVKPGDKVVTCWGKHALYNTLPERNVIRIPYKDVDMKDACFTLITTFSLAAVRKVGIELGESCLIAGAGLLGLFSAQFAHLAGAMPVIVSDLKPERRALALQLGADAALDPASPDYEDQLMALTEGKGADTVIEVTGNPAALNQALRSTARYGRVALLGCTRRPVETDFYHDIHYPGLTVYGAHTGVRPKYESYPGHWTDADDCATTLRYLAAKRFHVAQIIHETHSPEEAPEVFHRLAFEPDFPLGVVFDWSAMEQR